MLLNIEDYDLRDIKDLFEHISENEEKFQNSHKTIVEISKQLSYITLKTLKNYYK